MLKPASLLTTAAVAAMLSLNPAGSHTEQGIVLAQSASPTTGSAQGVNPSNSLPGGSAAFGASPSTSSTPMSAPAPSGAAQGVVTAPAGQGTGTISTTTPGATTPPRQ